MNNKKLGNDFEAELCCILFEHGFWCHNLAQNASGQPADIIAVRNGRAYLIDCKVCSDGKFDLRRVEENQESAMKLWRECGNGEGWFAFRLDEQIRMMAAKVLTLLKERQSALNTDQLFYYSTSLDVWITYR